MAEKRAQRRLAAIMAADVVGYSRLVEHDELGTLAALKARRRDVLVPVVVQHNGRVVDFTGDGVLVEFGSAVDAVQCAVKLQEGFAVANQSLSEKQQIVLRIGVNLGDIIVEGSKIYGDGVNVAARLEGLAEPGGIYVSASVQEQVSGKLSLAFDDLGEHTLKNIAKPVRVYRTGTDGNSNPTTLSLGTTKEKPSVAVLPFLNMSGDLEQQYFSDGITEDIITELSRFRSLLVIARNSSFQFRSATDVKKIAKELGVQYVVEGSIRKHHEQIRTSAQLIEAESGNHLWAEHYDRDIRELFAVQDEVTQAIATTIEGRMAFSGAQRSRRKPTNDLAAYDCFLQGRETIEQRGDHDFAMLLLRRAIKLDPDFAQAYAWLSVGYVFIVSVDLNVESLHEALQARPASSIAR